MKKILVLGLMTIFLLGMFSVVFADEDENMAKLTVTSIVNNNNGGDKTAENFAPYKVGETDINLGEETEFAAGTYVISLAEVDGYEVTFSETCEDGNVTLVADDIKTCEITITDLPGTLTVKNIVTNDNNGQADVNDFSFKINDGNAIAFEADGENVFDVNAGTYSIVAVAMAGYTTTYDNCSEVAIANGASVICTITNNDISDDDDENETDDDENETDDDTNETDDDTNETDDDTDTNETGNFGSSIFAMKIKLIHLLNTVQLKTVQAEFAVDYLTDNNSTIDVAPIEAEIANLEAITDRIQDKLDGNFTKEELLETFLTEKAKAKEAIKNIREYIRENATKEIRSAFRNEFKAQKRELKPEFHSRVKELVKAHNDSVKEKYTEALERVKAQKKTADPEEITEEFNQKVSEMKKQERIEQELAIKKNSQGGKNK